MALSKAARRFILCENTFRWQFLLKRRVWVHEVCKGRGKYGEYHHLFPVLRKHNSRFMDYMRMSTTTFDYISSLVKDDLEKQTTNWRRPIGAEERLVVTLRYLATGSSFRTLAFSFRMGVSTVKCIVDETCKVLWQRLVPEHMPKPTTEELVKSKEGFWNQWNFPNCVGALDGKHCRIKCPPHSNSKFYNYKKFFSILLQAVCDPQYKFLVIDVGGKGRQNDGGTFSSSSLYECLKNSEFNMPDDCELPGSTIKAPHVLIADEAYPLKTYLLKPYARQNLTPAKTTFNYRLSRARRCIECAFGILNAKWRILEKCIDTSVESATAIIKATCVLHNVIRDRDGENDPVFRELCFNARDGGVLHANRRNNRYTSRAQIVRDEFANYLKTQRLLQGNYD